jgi:thiamine pyrophosphokinase
MRVLLIANSPDFDSAYIARHARSFDRIIVTDGAAEKLPPAVTPHIICGDFDSLNLPVARERYTTSEFIALEDQNLNDLEKALMLALSRGATEVTIASAFGGRIDVSIANLSVLIRHHTACSLSMVHGEIMTKVVSDRAPHARSVSFEARRGSPVSCSALDSDAVVSLSNVTWALDQQTIRSGSHGVSNKASGGPVTITVHRGVVLVGYEIAACAEGSG